MHHIIARACVPRSFLDAALRSKSLACALHPANVWRKQFSTLDDLPAFARCALLQNVCGQQHLTSAGYLPRRAAAPQRRTRCLPAAYRRGYWLIEICSTARCSLL